MSGPPVDPRRSAIMRAVKGKNTKPELRVRSALHRAGYRFRLHRADLPGKPDVVFPGRRAAVFVHGCFWHRHDRCRAASTPSTRTEFWLQKFRCNVDRDEANVQSLIALGWRVHIVWECQTKGKPSFWEPLIEFLDGNLSEVSVRDQSSSEA
nr:very short patch repair endonuclease [Brevundimonas sp. NIBR11]